MAAETDIESKRGVLNIARQLPYITPEDLAFFRDKKTTVEQIRNIMERRRIAW